MCVHTLQLWIPDPCLLLIERRSSVRKPPSGLASQYLLPRPMRTPQNMFARTVNSSAGAAPRESTTRRRNTDNQHQ